MLRVYLCMYGSSVVVVNGRNAVVVVVVEVVGRVVVVVVVVVLLVDVVVVVVRVVVVVGRVVVVVRTVVGCVTGGATGPPFHGTKFIFRDAAKRSAADPLGACIVIPGYDSASP